MEDFITHLPYYAILLVMLLGAFVIGYIFGARSKKVIVVKTEKVRVPLTPNDKTHLKPDSKKNSENGGHNPIDLDDLSKPGSIRAMKTRERSGTLSSDVKTSIVEDKIDFSTIGRAEPHEKDDLQRIVGIGPYVEDQLNDIGIYKYSQLANMSDPDIIGITSLIDFFPGRIHRDDWKGQAALFKTEKR
ncbi:hypothetical protein [Nonlabens antarcticus]|uniref:hypothetical protein n=1 Tax=Nonlabens antarcticus TaxID=392714 RepID=UPI001890E3F6|nr:hypothetical protein [Nonlabens antarcticus]